MSNQMAAAGADTPKVPVAPPVRRMVCVAIAAWAGLLTAALLVGAQLSHEFFAIATFGVQAVFVICLTWQTRPPASWAIIVGALVAAAGADAGAVLWKPLSLTPLAYAVAGGFALALIGQLARRDGRERLTESFATALTAVVGAVAFAMPVALTRNADAGTMTLDGCLLAAGAAVIVARMSDTTLPLPRIAPHVARGAFGIVLGAMVGTAVSAYSGVVLVGPSPTRAAVAGLIVSVTAVLADLAVTYADVALRLDGKPVAPWPIRHALGPLFAFALAAPMAYLISVFYAAGN